MITILTIVPQAAALVLYARIADLGPNEVWPAQKRIIAGIMAIMLGLIAVSYAIGPNVIVVLAGESFLAFRKTFPDSLACTPGHEPRPTDGTAMDQPRNLRPDLADHIYHGCCSPCHDGAVR